MLTRQLHYLDIPKIIFCDNILDLQFIMFHAALNSHVRWVLSFSIDLKFVLLELNLSYYLFLHHPFVTMTILLDCSWSDSSDRQRFSMLSELNSAGSHRKPTERLPHTLRLRQEQTPIRRVNAHARRHSSETLVSGSFTKSKDTAKSPCDSNDAEQRDVKVEGNTIKSLIPTPRKLRL